MSGEGVADRLSQTVLFDKHLGLLFLGDVGGLIIQARTQAIRPGHGQQGPTTIGRASALEDDQGEPIVMGLRTASCPL